MRFLLGVTFGVIALGLAACGTSTAASSWQVVWHSKSNAIVELQCPSAEHCIAGGEPFSALETYNSTGQLPTRGLLALSVDGGARWRMTHVAGEILALACATRERCVAIARGGTGSYFPLVSSNGGATWKAGTASPVLDGVIDISCPSATRCIGVANHSQTGGQGSSEAVGAGVWSTDGGMHWVMGQTLGIGPVVGLSCPNAEHCVAVGEAESTPPQFGPPMVSVTMDGGHKWRPVGSIVGPIPQEIISISCPTATWCGALANGLGASPGEWLTTSDGGMTWQSVSLGGNHASGYPLAIACPVPESCVFSMAVGNTTAGTGLAEKIEVLDARRHSVIPATLASNVPHSNAEFPWSATPGITCPGVNLCYVAASGAAARIPEGSGFKLAPRNWFVLRGGVRP